jgi:hypothetical protein
VRHALVPEGHQRGDAYAVLRKDGLERVVPTNCFVPSSDSFAGCDYPCLSTYLASLGGGCREVVPRGDGWGRT